MELFSANYEENTRALDDLLGVGRCFDMIARDLMIGAMLIVLMMLTFIPTLSTFAL